MLYGSLSKHFLVFGMFWHDYETIYFDCCIYSLKQAAVWAETTQPLHSSLSHLMLLGENTEQSADCQTGFVTKKAANWFLTLCDFPLFQRSRVVKAWLPSGGCPGASNNTNTPTTDQLLLIMRWIKLIQYTIKHKIELEKVPGSNPWLEFMFSLVLPTDQKHAC